MRQQILLDMDGVLADFLSGAIKALNRDFNRDITIRQYATDFHQWETYDYYDITQQQFWASIENTPDFWLNLEPMPWAKDLYEFLSYGADVTILTSPSLDPKCPMEKLLWLKKHLNVDSSSVFMGSRKYLMAGNGLLIDDYYKNVDSFRAAGGEAVLVPSTWNDPDLTFNKVLNAIINRD